MPVILASLIGPVGRVTADPTGPRCAGCRRLIYFTAEHRRKIMMLVVEQELKLPAVIDDFEFKCQDCHPLEGKLERYEARYEKRNNEQNES